MSLLGAEGGTPQTPARLQRRITRSATASTIVGLDHSLVDERRVCETDQVAFDSGQAFAYDSDDGGSRRSSIDLLPTTASKRRLLPRDEFGERRSQQTLGEDDGLDSNVRVNHNQRRPSAAALSLSDMLLESPGSKVPRSPRVDAITPTAPNPHHSLPPDTSVFCSVECALLLPSRAAALKNEPKRRGAKRESNESGASWGSGHSRASLRERPSRSSLAVPPTGASKGRWTPATVTLRDSGVLSVSAEGTMICELRLSQLDHTEVKLVDHSLLSRSHVLALPLLVDAQAFDMPMASGFGDLLKHDATSRGWALEGVSDVVERVYLAFSDRPSLATFYATAQCFTRAIQYGEPVLPSFSSFVSTSSGSAKSTRAWRSLEITIVEGRSLGERIGAAPLPSTRSAPLALANALRGTSPTPLSSSPRSIHLMSSERPGTGGTTSSDASDGSSSLSSSIGMAHLDLLCEVSVNEEVVARTTSKKGTVSPSWRERFVLRCTGLSRWGFVAFIRRRDLPFLTSPLVIRVYQAPTRKSARSILVGTVAIPVSILRKSVGTEAWSKVTYRDPRRFELEHVGDLNLAFSFADITILPGAEYDGLRTLLNTDEDALLAYELVAELPKHLDEIAERLLRIYLVEGRLGRRLMQMAEIEVDGQASILFRGKSLLTKMMELYLRLIGQDFLRESIADTVDALCADRVEIEIDPSRVRATPKDRSLEANVRQLEWWTTYLWNRLYQARHKCPTELKQLFQHIQRVVENRYDARKTTMRFTCISAFVFLRFFVPALLAPRSFGLCQSAPEAGPQRTLTLIAKTLQGLANMRLFENKEPYMAALNPFIAANKEAFIDYISYLADPGEAIRPGWTSSRAPQYFDANTLRQSLDAAHRDRVPALPHLIDESQELAQLARLAAHAQDRSKGEGSLLSTSPAAADCFERTRRKRSKGIEPFMAACIELDARAAKDIRRTLSDVSCRPAATPNSRSIKRPSTSPPRTSSPSPQNRVLSRPTNGNQDGSFHVISRAHRSNTLAHLPENVPKSPTRPALPRASTAGASLSARLRRVSSGEAVRSRTRSDAAALSREHSVEGKEGSTTFRKLFGWSNSK